MVEVSCKFTVVTCDHTNLRWEILNSCNSGWSHVDEVTDAA